MNAASAVRLVRLSSHRLVETRAFRRVLSDALSDLVGTVFLAIASEDSLYYRAIAILGSGSGGVAKGSRRIQARVVSAHAARAEL